MVYSYTPAYYSSVHDTITGLCKNILSIKNRRLISRSEKNLAKRQSDNLKWQQDSFHRILNLIGRHKAGIATADDVSSARSDILKTLINLADDQEPAAIIRDKLLFLRELLYAECISSEDYHTTKRPLLRKLADQGAEIDCKDVIARGHDPMAGDEWSEIDLKDKELTMTEKPKSKTKQLINSIKPIKQAVSFVKSSAGRAKESRPITRWKRSKCDDDDAASPYLPLGERSDERPEIKRIKKKLNPDGASSEFLRDKALGENIKKELSRIQSELHSRNHNLDFSDDQIKAISSKLPVEKTDLERFFPRTWCDRYGGVVIDVVKKEFKEHVVEMENKKNNAEEQQGQISEENKENFSSNMFLQDQTFLNEKPKSCFAYNPFIDYDDDHDHDRDLC